MMNIQAVKDKMYVKVSKVEEKTAGGLFIAVEPENQPHRIGEVLSIGEEVPADAIKVGDKVVFAKFGGQTISLLNDSTEYKILCWSEVYGVLKD